LGVFNDGFHNRPMIISYALFSRFLFLWQPLLRLVQDLR
jgi:hypothetical protein